MIVLLLMVKIKDISTLFFRAKLKPKYFDMSSMEQEKQKDIRCIGTIVERYHVLYSSFNAPIIGKIS